GQAARAAVVATFSNERIGSINRSLKPKGRMGGGPLRKWCARVNYAKSLCGFRGGCTVRCITRAWMTKPQMFTSNCLTVRKSASLRRGCNADQLGGDEDGALRGRARVGDGGDEAGAAQAERGLQQAGGAGAADDHVVVAVEDAGGRLVEARHLE